jgi:hypothetical protein
MAFNGKQIKSINIKIDNGTWNPDTHYIILTRNPKNENGVSINIVAIAPQPEPTIDLSDANKVLNKFRTKKE